MRPLLLAPLEASEAVAPSCFVDEGVVRRVEVLERKSRCSSILASDLLFDGL